ncbi:MAG: hypothetical protein KDK70_28110, partial [Myxococcales bacterium]|nr:hypothetical protein [Myxococcales bacterium]
MHGEGVDRGPEATRARAVLSRRAWMTGAAALLGGCATARRPSRVRLDQPATAWRRDLHEMIDVVVERHVAPFHGTSEAQLQAQVSEVEARLPDLSAVERVVAFSMLLASVGDAHTRLETPAEVLGPRLPLATRSFSDGVYVIAAHHAHLELLGTRVLDVEGQPLDRALRAVEPMVSADTVHGRRAEAATLLGFPQVLHACGLTRGPKGARLLLQHGSGAARERGLLAVDSPGTASWVTVGQQWNPRPLAERNPRRH